MLAVTGANYDLCSSLLPSRQPQQAQGSRCRDIYLEVSLVWLQPQSRRVCLEMAMTQWVNMDLFTGHISSDRPFGEASFLKTGGEHCTRL